MKLFMIITFSLCVLYIQVINGIVIKDIVVPSMVTLDDDDSNDNLRLDCIYELNENPSHLVVKWFMNNNAIYQWIRGKPPSILPHFKDNIEITTSPELDENHLYRGFTLTNPSVEISGTYKCLVQTENDSKSKEKELRVVDISNHTMKLDKHQVQNETHLKCTVNNVFPEPKLHLDSENGMATITLPETKIVVQENGYYDAILTAVAQSSDDKDTFSCYATFEGLPLNISATDYTSGVSVVNTSKFSLLILLFISFSWTLSKLL